eukprot:1148011-Pelagomonas_calceolata.AAC.4
MSQPLHEARTPAASGPPCRGLWSPCWTQPPQPTPPRSFQQTQPLLPNCRSSSIHSCPAALRMLVEQDCCLHWPSRCCTSPSGKWERGVEDRAGC